MTRFLVRFLVGLTFFSSVSLANIVQEGYLIQDPDHQWLKVIKQHPDLTLDHVKLNHFEVWGPEGLGTWLRSMNADFYSLPRIQSFVSSDYPTFDQMSNELKTLTQKYPKTAKLISIGKSVKGRDLWVVKVSRNVGLDDARPEFKYIANMHGDEIVGRELMIRLLHELLEKDGQDSTITQLLDRVQIYILPSMNPDGANNQSRGNANYVDLNRDFPEFTNNDPNSTAGRAVETQALMKWQAAHHFKLSANLHGGAEVVNYPWDATPNTHPLENYLKKISLEYAKLTSYLAASTTFENGITNGYAWYQVLGGMQDWSYHWHNDIQVTIELSDDKWPNYSTIDYYWTQNKTALLDLIQQTLSL